MTVSVDGAVTSLIGSGASTVPSGQTYFTTGAGYGLGIFLFGTDDSGTVPAGQVGFGFGAGTHFKGASVVSGTTDLTMVVTFLVVG
jgi:hypothetical protein